MQDSSDSIVSWIGNSASVGTVVSSLLGWLPPAAALIAFVWYLIQIYESKTIRRWLERRRVRKIAQHHAAIIILETKGALEAIEDLKSKPSGKT